MKTIGFVLGVLMFGLLASASSYKDCSVYGNCATVSPSAVIVINETLFNVNNSQYLEGYNSSSFWKAYENQVGLTGNKDGSFNLSTSLTEIDGTDTRYNKFEIKPTGGVYNFTFFTLGTILDDQTIININSNGIKINSSVSKDSNQLGNSYINLYHLGNTLRLNSQLQSIFFTNGTFGHTTSQGFVFSDRVVVQGNLTVNQSIDTENMNISGNVTFWRRNGINFLDNRFPNVNAWMNARTLLMKSTVSNSTLDSGSMTFTNTVGGTDQSLSIGVGALPGISASGIAGLFTISSPITYFYGNIDAQGNLTVQQNTTLNSLQVVNNATIAGASFYNNGTSFFIQW